MQHLDDGYDSSEVAPPRHALKPVHGEWSTGPWFSTTSEVE